MKCKAVAAGHPLSRRLLCWFDRVRRDLPWRQTRDPYRIWVAEVMLQQTQVSRAALFYERFLEVFPTVEALAISPLDMVLRLWQGLGYYSRARNLQAASRVIMRRHGGRFPDSFDEAMALPGVGRYTAGAVLSIAYGVRVPAVDANARRVLKRVFYERDSASTKPIEQVASEAVPADRPGDFNQALMELGSLVCLPGRPRCMECCLAEKCAALSAGVTESVPKAKRRRRLRIEKAIGAVVSRRGRVLIVQRPEDGVWGCLWEFPNILSDGAESNELVLRELLATQFGLEVDVGEKLRELQYGIMDRRVRLVMWSCKALRGRTRARWHVRSRWVRPGELAQYALPAPHGKIAAIVADQFH